MRIAHATDIHFQRPPGLADLRSFKRALGAANLYLAGRRHHFQLEVQRALVDHLVGLAPDLVLLTGDFTATALASEFALAREVLDPVLARFPTFIVPGNHDVYTRGAQREGRIRQVFGPWMHLGEDRVIARMDHGDLTVLGLDPNRPTWLHASGELPDAQLEALEHALHDPTLAGRTVILALHYPILDRAGAVYDHAHHGLRNARALIALLRRAPVRPAMIVHGHEHHGFTVDLDCGGVRVPIFDCGSSGYAYLPRKGRAAAMNLYTLDGGEVEVERFLYDGQGFAPEPGGAYATGR